MSVEAWESKPMQSDSSAEFVQPRLGSPINCDINADKMKDPLLEQLPSSVARHNDHVILVFADGRQQFVQCAKSRPLKFNKRNYSTATLIGLPYGTVLELEKGNLIPLSEGEDLLATDPSIYLRSGDDSGSADDDSFNDSDTQAFALDQTNDNRYLDDLNTSQSIKPSELASLKETAHGSEIVKALVANSATFDSKTDFSKAKYIARKQKKYQIRCRLVQCTASSICEVLYLKDPRKMMNLRVDTLAQILSYSNASAGSQVLVMETCMGLVTGAFAQRMGGYGKVISVYSGQQPSFLDMLSKFNLTFSENHSIKWVHSGDVFGDDAMDKSSIAIPDQEQLERDAMEWPCPIQDHTRDYVETQLTDDKLRKGFLAKRASRFARKLTRDTPNEVHAMLLRRPCDALVIASRYDPTSTLMSLLPFLAPSCTFVVFCEFLEPLTECFQELQKRGLAINIRLSDTWMREYQVLAGRTRPNMHMSQNGGFILTGIKLCPETGHNELDEELLQELKLKHGGRRGRKLKAKGDKRKAESQKASQENKRTRARTSEGNT